MPEINRKMNKAPQSMPVQDMSNSGWYARWHAKDHHALTHWLIFIVAVVVAWLLLYISITNWVVSFNQPGVTVHISTPTTELVLDPQTTTVNVGDTIAANIVLDTGGNHVDGVDIYSLHYDPSLLKVTDEDSSKPGVQIQPGTILNLNAANMVDTTSGTIKFGQVAAGGTSYMGKGVLATIHFKALATGTAYLKFDFTPGSTTDSNAAFKGKDQLAKVVDAIYTIQAK